jgi:hypothetical protein
MLNSVRKIKGVAALACLATAITLGFVGTCAGQTTDDGGSGQPDTTASSDADAPPLIVDPSAATKQGCTSVVVNCDTSSRFATPDHQLVNSATARDEAQRKQAQADRAAAEQSLQRRIEFARTHPNAIFVYGNRSAPAESVTDVFNRTLGASYTSLTTTSFSSSGDRTECVNACHGPACCVTTSSAADGGK